jgi:hypothetical protein
MNPQSPPSPPAVDLGELSAATFFPHIGDSFTIQIDAETNLDLELLEVTNPARSGPPGPPQGDRRAPFSIVFRAATAPLLPQSVYAIAHGQIGRLDIFIVPIGPDKVGMLYQAVFT